MKVQVKIIQAEDFIQINPGNELNLKACKHLLEELAYASADLHEYAILIDLRNTQFILDTADIYALAAELDEYGNKFQKCTAILVDNPEALNQISFSGNVPPRYAMHINAFSDFEKAVKWLVATSNLVPVAA